MQDFMYTLKCISLEREKLCVLKMNQNYTLQTQLDRIYNVPTFTGFHVRHIAYTMRHTPHRVSVRMHIHAVDIKLKTLLAGTQTSSVHGMVSGTPSGRIFGPVFEQ